MGANWPKAAYSPLGRGFLTGAIKSFSDIDGRRSAHPRFQEQNFDQNRALVAKIEAVAAEKSCTPSQVTLAWLLAQGPDVVAIPGTRYAARLDENVGALNVALSAEEVARISAAVPVGAAAGTRYPAGGIYLVLLSRPGASGHGATGRAAATFCCATVG
jgi:aryl-alcohol dehydrogenase-like predicted oxidoreductase